MRLLFVSWDGPEQSYLESLFLPLMSGLRRHGVQPHVLSLRFGRELGDSERAAARLGVGMDVHRIHRRPNVLLGSVATLGQEVPRLIALCRSLDADVLMPRSLLPGALCLGAMPVCPPARLLFDADGLLADERVELAGWPSSGSRYRALRTIEKTLLERADAVVTRTSRSRDVLLERGGALLDPRAVHVIPNGVDETRFRLRDEAERAEVRARFGIAPTAPLVVYSGSIGPQYLSELSFVLFARIARARPDARLLVLSGAHREARRAIAAAGLPAESYRVARIPPEQMPALLGAADLGLALRLPTFSQAAVSPIKVSEFLMSGLPTVATYGVGDLDHIFEGVPALHRVSAAAPDLDGAVRWFLEGPLANPAACRAACRAVGERTFALSTAAERLARVVHALPAPKRR